VSGRGEERDLRVFLVIILNINQIIQSFRRYKGEAELGEAKRCEHNKIIKKGAF
jgi:hypothetical protein